MRKRSQKGFIVSTELILIATILVIGLIVGLSAVRVAVVTELADIGDAIGNLNQSYSVSGAAGHHALTSGSSFLDAADTCDNGTITQAGVNSRCVTICTVDAAPELPNG